MKCPMCEAPVKSIRDNPAFPFCSERCRLTDLGKWLDEDYRIPAQGEADVESEPDGDEPEPGATPGRGGSS